MNNNVPPITNKTNTIGLKLVLASPVLCKLFFSTSLEVAFCLVSTLNTGVSVFSTTLTSESFTFDSGDFESLLFSDIADPSLLPVDSSSFSISVEPFSSSVLSGIFDFSTAGSTCSSVDYSLTSSITSSEASSSVSTASLSMSSIVSSTCFFTTSSVNSSFSISTCCNAASRESNSLVRLLSLTLILIFPLVTP